MLKSFVIPEWFFDVLQGVGLIFLFAWLFYDSVWAVLPLSPFLWFWCREREKGRREKEEELFRKMFREWILLLSASLGAGYSVENAFQESFHELQVMFPKGGIMVEEVRTMLIKSENNQRPEILLKELAKRHPVEEVSSFAEVFCAARRSGGSLSSIIKNTSAKMVQIMDTKREIQTLLAAKIYEQKIMTVMPLAIILYIRAGSADFLKSLYHNLPGIAVMTICLVIYAAAYTVGKKLVRFDI